MLFAFPTPVRRLLPALLVLVLAAAGLVVAGCGSSGGGSENADPAKVAPKNSLVYLSAQVRPEGDQKDAVDSIAKKVLGVDDPGKRIQTLLDQSIKESDSKLTYEDDIEPWLGRRAAIVVTSFGSGTSDTQTAAIIASKDNGKAQDAIDKLADEQNPKADQADLRRGRLPLQRQHRRGRRRRLRRGRHRTRVQGGRRRLQGRRPDRQHAVLGRGQERRRQARVRLRRHEGSDQRARGLGPAAGRRRRASRDSSDRPTSRSRSRWRRPRPGSPSRPSPPRRRRPRPSPASC